MANTIVKTLEKPHLSIKVQSMAAIFAIVGAVVVPQFFHLLGAVSGLGTALGETVRPMHLPIILVGLLAGPYAGAVAGLLGPVASFALSGMPRITMLPFMMLELCTYGLVSIVLPPGKNASYGSSRNTAMIEKKSRTTPLASYS